MKQSEPCLACRIGSTDSHISIERGKACHALHLADHSSSNRLRSRSVTPERATRRVVNQRKSSRISSSMVVSSAPEVGSILDPLSSPPNALVTLIAETIHTHDHDVGDKGEMEINIVCPKLKSRNDLQYSEDLPFVHGNEIPLHAIDARAAPTSHFTGRSTATSEELEYSETVDCSGTVLSSPIVLDRTTPLEPPVTIATVKEVHGANDPVRLRGGSGLEEGSSKKPSSKLKRWKNFCYVSHQEDFDRDSDAQPSRVCVEKPIRVVKTRETLRENLRGETNGATSLPAQTSQGFQRTCTVRETWSEVADHPNRMSVTTTISGPPSPRPSSSSSLLSRLLLKYRYGQRPVESSATQSKRNSLSWIPSKSVPHLRGGAESPERTPPSLYWLAGGTGKKPVSIDGWKQSRPKQRMGRLLGMAVFGSKYGQEYKVQANVSGDLGTACSASVKVTAEGTEVVHVSGGTDAPQPKSRSGSCWSEAAEAKPAEEAKPVEEAAVVADEAALIEPAPPREISENVEETVPIESEEAMAAPAHEDSEDVKEAASIEAEEAIQRALSPPPADPADDVPLCSGAPPGEISDETAPIESEEYIQRALSPPPADPADDVPLCSGALPVENGLHTPHEDSPPVHHSQEEKKDNDTASEGRKE